MAKRGRKKKQGKREPNGRLSRAAFDHGTQHAQAMQVLYGNDGCDAIGRAYRAGLLGEDLRAWDGQSPDDLARVGRDYRRAMEREFGGDYAKMFAAYNAGPGRVQEAIRKGGNNWIRHLPAETQNYITRNMRALGGR